MGTYSSAVWYGLVQGVSEAFPVSSSLHIRLLSQWLGPLPDAKATAALFHAGSFVGICWYFARDIQSLLYSLWRPYDPHGAPWRALWVQLIVGSLGLASMVAVVTFGLPGLLGGKLARDPTWSSVAGVAFAAAVCLHLAHGRLRSLRGRGQPLSWSQSVSVGVSLGHAWLIGSSQIMAMLWSGVSRLGATLTVACCLGYPLAQATSFSFLLGLPVMGASIVYGWYTHGGSYPFSGLSAAVLAGVACISTWGALRFMGYLARTDRVWPITVYRILLSFWIWGYAFFSGHGMAGAEISL